MMNPADVLDSLISFPFLAFAIPNLKDEFPEKQAENIDLPYDSYSKET